MIRPRGRIVLAAAWLGTLGPTAALAETPVLQLLDVVKIAEKSEGFSEPSGLARTSDGTGDWSVSDDTGKIFRLSPNGRLQPSRTLHVGAKGLEAVVEDTARNRLLAAREEMRQIVAISLTDGTVTLHPLKDMEGYPRLSGIFGPTGSNNGLEGITIDGATGDVVVIKESNPRLLIRIDADLTAILGVTELTQDHGFACPGADDVTLDVSDISYDPTRERFWILSDSGACVFLYDPEADRAISLQLPGSADNPHKHVKNPEGIALTADGSGLRIVTDDGKDSRLYTYSID